MAFQLAYIGLGSNLESPIEQVLQALNELATLPLSRLTAASSLYASRPVGPQDQPDFINAVVALETRLSPLALLDQLQALEQQHRRRRQRHWGPARSTLTCCSTLMTRLIRRVCAYHTRK
ncbi:hypothetical protein HSBAA_05610 [Vreelandella sulfidaeris]|uniref:2-amino-4-hydroxy-6-hydroxymethyldihydropteridine pyrophosphokinase n=1 Tax=Vreelandella sulfidaeris TaxID=115553 RepID=A0A455U0L6_9GAMM|nr:hypothetical protein HSBAA_05610 [Halomonas sulfidaeris]